MCDDPHSTICALPDAPLSARCRRETGILGRCERRPQTARDKRGGAGQNRCSLEALGTVARNAWLTKRHTSQATANITITIIVTFLSPALATLR